MSSLKSIGIVVAVIGALIGLLFATGVVSVRKHGEDDAAVDPELESLSYLNTPEMSAEDKRKRLVTVHKRGAERDGLGIAVPIGSGLEFRELRARGHDEALRFARLIDMEGKELHRWSDPVGRGNSPEPGWAVAKVRDDGALFAIDNRAAVVELDWDSKVEWEVAGAFHHDLDFRPEGGVVVLSERPVRLLDEGEPYFLLDDGFVWLSEDGSVEKEFWVHEALEDEEFYQRHVARRNERWRDTRRAKMEAQDSFSISCGFSEPKLQKADFIHANSVEILRRDIEGVGKKGDILTTLRELDMIATFSAEDGRLLWFWGTDALDRPHDPSLLDNGNILVFDNGWHRKRSRLVELDPSREKVVWRYGGKKKNKLWSKKRGLAQKLSNGHYLANSSQAGRAVEISRKGTVVWDYYSPDILGDYRIPMRYIRLQGDAADSVRRLLREHGGSPGAPITGS